MTSIEKKMLAAIGVCIIGIIFSVHSCNSSIEKAGGMKAIIIDAGKEVKEISREINKEESDKQRK